MVFILILIWTGVESERFANSNQHPTKQMSFITRKIQRAESPSDFELGESTNYLNLNLKGADIVHLSLKQSASNEVNELATRD